MTRAQVLGAAAVVLLGCATGPRAWVVSGNASSEWASRAVALAEEVRRVRRPLEPWGGTIFVHPDRFPCCPYDGQPCGTCAGWQPARGRVEVAWTPDPLGADSTLGHELCHAACRPFLTSGANGCSEEEADACGRLAVQLTLERLVP